VSPSDLLDSSLSVKELPFGLLVQLSTFVVRTRVGRTSDRLPGV